MRTGTIWWVFPTRVGVNRQPYPRLVVLDPSTVTVRWEPDDIETVTSYRIQSPAIDPQTGKPIVVRQLVERDGQDGLHRYAWLVPYPGGAPGRPCMRQMQYVASH